MAQPLPSDMPASASTCEIAWGSAFWYPSSPRQILSCEGLVWAKDLRLRWLEPTMEARLFAVLLHLHAWQLLSFAQFRQSLPGRSAAHPALASPSDWLPVFASRRESTAAVIKPEKEANE
ncbi:hypothetical protein CFAM422_004624 [Trichoderma lentiforme]|uniref:Uncharacterized protein n=1 Tax=Trichoderma lentiforme TaxID=1567552 RepID=A0A9P4XF86_9HYPO|nr:hypothetical protein CFAM422_004624 [Trichoderma lentiforme]